MSIKELDLWCRLRNRGYEFNAMPGRGFRLVLRDGYRVSC